METVSELTPAALNELFQPLQPEERIRTLFDYFEESEVLLTSSFGIHSALLLYLMHLVKPQKRAYFINTQFHFPETLAYKEQLADLWGLEIEELEPSCRSQLLVLQRRMWESQPDACCYLNKVWPLEPLKKGHKVWVSGLMGYQAHTRRNLQAFEKPRPGETIWRFYPLIDLTEQQYAGYKREFHLPPHPLEGQGYGSVGCLHCTVKGNGREGRWKGSDKTECGLHQ
ncbi:MAG: phosphoadenylyl-sulfate reductase [Phaeodactylibacter sp.]|nr:phosphoadenylyl-sulfate reductase [Phaeodactylibacter sp.]